MWKILMHLGHFDQIRTARSRGMWRKAVGRREWLTRADFLDLLGAANLIPGPSSTQLAMSLGYRRAGWAGLVPGGVCFILPASLLTVALAWAYVRYGRLPQTQGLLHGIKPVVLAIVFQALWNLGKTAFRTRVLAVLGGLALAAFLDGINVGALALMASVTWALSRAAVVDPWTAALGAASGFLLIRFKVNATWLVLGGGAGGLLLVR